MARNTGASCGLQGISLPSNLSILAAQARYGWLSLHLSISRGARGPGNGLYSVEPREGKVGRDLLATLHASWRGLYPELSVSGAAFVRGGGNHGCVYTFTP
ncbi:hypothetical protein J6590_058350 [Homalodisca vitripennis]|nr:hypothetical protein J6590_058350 [Homalodisca vitripennis]